MSSTNFFSKLPDHSKAKVDLLEQYLTRYFRIIGNLKYINTINIYDLFCGQGIYDNNEYGSPIAIIDAYYSFIEGSLNNNVSHSKFVFYFNDIEKEKIEKLKHNVNERYKDKNEKANILFLSLDYTDTIPKIIHKNKLRENEEKNFLFIDPCGYREIDIDDIAKLLNNNNLEILLFLPIQQMYRFSKNGTPNVLNKTIEKLGIQIEEIQNAYDFSIAILNGFKNILSPRYVDCFHIRKDPNTDYCLYFFTNHIRGYEKMLEAKWCIDKDNGNRFTYNTTIELFPQNDFGFELENRLIEFLKTIKTNKEIYEFVLNEGFLPQHVNKVLQSLIKKGKIVFKSHNQKILKYNDSFHIDYDNYKHYNKNPQIRLFQSIQE